jgi:hypothetical protein
MRSHVLQDSITGSLVRSRLLARDCSLGTFFAHSGYLCAACIHCITTSCYDGLNRLYCSVARARRAGINLQVP